MHVLHLSAQWKLNVQHARVKTDFKLSSSNSCLNDSPAVKTLTTASWSKNWRQPYSTSQNVGDSLIVKIFILRVYGITCGGGGKKTGNPLLVFDKALLCVVYTHMHLCILSLFISIKQTNKQWCMKHSLCLSRKTIARWLSEIPCTDAADSGASAAAAAASESATEAVTAAHNDPSSRSLVCYQCTVCWHHQRRESTPLTRTREAGHSLVSEWLTRSC